MRQIKAADNLVADVEGDIEEFDGVLRITTIRLKYRLKIPKGTKEKVERVLSFYAEKCPAFQSVKECIRCTWKIDMQEE